VSRAPDFSNAIAFARDLIRIESLPGEEGALAARVRTEMEDLAFDDVWVDGAGNVIGRLRGTGAGPVAMLSCHLDAVDVGDVAGWKHGPFDAVIEDGRLHGRGAMDIKGPLAVQTYAAARLRENRPAGDVIVAHTVLEERGGLGMEYLLRAGEVKPDAVLIGESTHGDLCIGHRGRAEIVIELRGVAAHASAPERAKNPLSLLGPVLAALDRFGASLESDPLLGRSTLAATFVETPHRSRNVIPDLVRIVIDWRILPSRTSADAVASVRDIVRSALPDDPAWGMDVRFATDRQTSYTGFTQDRSLFTPGFLMEQDHPVVRAAAGAIAQTLGRAPIVRPWTFATDGGHTCGVGGIPTIGFAPGEERFAHTNREQLDLREAEACLDAYPSLIAAVQAAART
jgi:putative selenium metabolism hydrolase